MSPINHCATCKVEAFLGKDSEDVFSVLRSLLRMDHHLVKAAHCRLALYVPFFSDAL